MHENLFTAGEGKSGFWGTNVFMVKQAGSYRQQSQSCSSRVFPGTGPRREPSSSPPGWNPEEDMGTGVNMPSMFIHSAAENPELSGGQIACKTEGRNQQVPSEQVVSESSQNHSSHHQVSPQKRNSSYFANFFLVKQAHLKTMGNLESRFY